MGKECTGGCSDLSKSHSKFMEELGMQQEFFIFRPRLGPHDQGLALAAVQILCASVHAPAFVLGSEMHCPAASGAACGVWLGALGALAGATYLLC